MLRIGLAIVCVLAVFVSMSGQVARADDAAQVSWAPECDEYKQNQYRSFVYRWYRILDQRPVNPGYAPELILAKSVDIHYAGQTFTNRDDFFRWYESAEKPKNEEFVQVQRIDVHPAELVDDVTFRTVDAYLLRESVDDSGQKTRVLTKCTMRISSEINVGVQLRSYDAVAVQEGAPSLSAK